MHCLDWDLGGQSSISPSATDCLGPSEAITPSHPQRTHTGLSFLICKKRGGDCIGFFLF